MLRLVRLTLCLLLVGMSASVAQSTGARAEHRVAVDFFYDDLEPDGYWVEHRYYGMVWYPRHRAPEWQPYVDGRWVWTADYGWYWDSYEPWGWAVYHYGRWVYTVEYGWVWAPDDVWGPAWVDWRYGDGRVGWAPMPPEARWRSGAFVSVHIDLSAPRYYRSWVFVSEGDFVRGNVRARRIPPSRNEAMLRASARVTSYASVNGRIVNRSLDIGRLSASTKIRIHPTSVATTEAYVRGGTLARGQGHVSIYRPRVVAKATVKSHRRREAYDRFEAEGDIDVGRPSMPPVDIGGRTSTDIGIGGRGPGGPGIGVGAGGGIRIGR